MIEIDGSAPTTYDPSIVNDYTKLTSRSSMILTSRSTFDKNVACVRLKNFSGVKNSFL